MRAVIKESFLHGLVDAIPSKSFLHRILLAAALADTQTEVCGKLFSQDVLATLDCIVQLGAEVEETENGWIISPIWQNRQITPHLDCRESGSTLRFLIPVSAALGGAELSGAAGLSARPNAPLIDCLKQHGVQIEGNALPLTVSGGMQSGTYKIDGGISSQYITGLLFALPLLDGDSRIVIGGDAVSAGYIQITLQVLRQFGIFVQEQQDGFLVRGGQRFRSPKCVSAEGDWSNAAFFLAAGAICGDVTIKNLNLNSVQGDRQIADILVQMGAAVKCKKNAVTVKQSKLKCIAVDAEHIPDLVPILSVLCAYADGVSQISGVARLTIKESNRLANVLTMLSKLGIAAEHKNDTIFITGGTPKAADFDGCNDHRMVMSQTIAAFKADGVSTVDGIEAVEKSYPHFFEDAKMLGGNADVESF